MIATLQLPWLSPSQTAVNWWCSGNSSDFGRSGYDRHQPQGGCHVVELKFLSCHQRGYQFHRLVLETVYLWRFSLLKFLECAQPAESQLRGALKRA
jgi:hypothetical protein